MKITEALLLVLFFKTSCALGQVPNTLTTAEKADGWQLLFDGRSFDGLQKLADGGWEIKDGALMATAFPPGKQMDIITEAQFANFELVFEFTIEKNTNSGIKYLVTNDYPNQKGAYLGLEYQILDDINYHYPDRGELRSVASLYDLIPADPAKQTKALGQWNTARIVVNGNKISHWLNGRKVVDYDRSSEKFKELVAKSKYKDLLNFGKAKKGHILFQNEGTPVLFRNIKIKESRR